MLCSALNLAQKVYESTFKKGIGKFTNPARECFSCQNRSYSRIKTVIYDGYFYNLNFILAWSKLVNLLQPNDKI